MPAAVRKRREIFSKIQPAERLKALKIKPYNPLIFQLDLKDVLRHKAASRSDS